MSHRVEMELGGRTLIIESGKLAKQANGAVTVQYGDSMVVSAACANTEPKLGIDFFPLTVEYREKSYAAGKIPGGFFKREGRPSEKEVLSARLIDRPIRPLFPADFRGETQLINFIISHDQKNDTDVMALTATGASLAISDIPITKTVAGVRVGRLDGQFVVNPTIDQYDECDLVVIIAGSDDAITMVEGSAGEVSESDLVDALSFGHEYIKQIIAKIDELKEMCGKEDFEYTPVVSDDTLKAKVTELVGDKLEGFNKIADKESRNAEKKNLMTKILDDLAEEFPETEKDIKGIIHDLDSDAMRGMILNENTRIDGRGPDDVREITCEVGFLPRAHGSSLFTRGQTQALVAVTLGTKMDEQRLDELDGESTKSYMLHYNFPPFSVGETRPIRGTSRREVGHGNLAERALFPVIPSEDGFPYTVRIVSDIMESNGSSSMASVCGGSLALMDAGVPIKSAVAGIAMGLIKSDDKVVILTDILGDEDHFGDMDFKVTGTTEGVTAIQMDIKIAGLDLETMRQALDKARTARLHILDIMNAAMPKHRSELSQYAPRIITIKIPPSKIGEVIGPGGKMIRSIVEETGAKIDIEDDGTVRIASVDGEAGRLAMERVLALAEEAEVGKVYSGVVRRTAPFGAFIEIMNAAMPKHRSELSQYAPRIITIKIPPSKIGEVIGPGGKMIRSIVEETGAKIDIEDDGTVRIASVDGEAGRLAMERVLALAEEAEVGKVYSGVVRRTAPFGAFIEIIPGTDGLLHISEIDHTRIERVEDVLNVGDRVDVKVINIDGDGKIRLSRKVLLTNDRNPKGAERSR